MVYGFNGSFTENISGLDDLDYESLCVKVPKGVHRPQIKYAFSLNVKERDALKKIADAQGISIGILAKKILLKLYKKNPELLTV